MGQKKWLSLSIYFFLIFPFTVIVSWDVNPPEESVTQYTMNYNGIVYTVPAYSCSTECSQSIVLNSTGPHTVSITASNMWGTGPENSVTFNVTVPGRSNNIRIRVED